MAIAPSPIILSSATTTPPPPPFLSISDLPNNVLRDTPKKANPLQSVSKNGDEGGRESTPLLPG